jgi:ferritin-like metal-binding protein YciE
MKIDSLQNLYISELKDLYNAEKQIIKALPKMAKAASSSELQQAFKEHLEETKQHVSRLEQVFESLGKSASGKTCKGMEGIIEEGEEMISEAKDDSVRDAALIAAAQRVEHYEIAAYGTVRTYAQQLSRNDDARLLQQTLDEEGNTDKRLTDLAESMINVEAV